MDIQTGWEVLKRDAAQIVSEESLRQRLFSGKKLTVKLGADPSRPDLHLGHSVVLRKLRLLQDLGHEVVFVIGDFTGMIGDPTGRSKTRQPLTFEQTRENGETYFKQVTKILDPERTRITYNSQWLGKMDFSQVLKLAGKYTVARILERDDFKTRLQEGAAIGMHELFYPLMQGYDSVALRADVEVGGTDQTFNLLVGRELQRDYGQPAQDVITFPLLPGLDGVEKMSKSLDNYIGIDEEPGVMFFKCMKVPDTLLGLYFRLTTDLPEKEFGEVLARDIREAHFLYAREITALYHGAEQAQEAERRYMTVAQGGAPDEVPVFRGERREMGLVELLHLTGLAPSNGEARRLLQGRGVRVDGQTVEDVAAVLTGPGSWTLQRGKNRFVRVLLP